MIEVQPFIDKLDRLKEYMSDVVDGWAMIENIKLNYKHKLDISSRIDGVGKPSFEIWMKNKYGGGMDYTMN